MTFTKSKNYLVKVWVFILTLVRFQPSPLNAGNGVIWLAHVVNLFQIETYNTTNNDEFWFP